jgi:hypothetical protein
MRDPVYFPLQMYPVHRKRTGKYANMTPPPTGPRAHGRTHRNDGWFQAGGWPQSDVGGVPAGQGARFASGVGR